MSLTSVQALQLVWVQFIEGRMSIPVMFANETANRPTGEYATVAIPVMTPVGHHHLRHENITVDIPVLTEGELQMLSEEERNLILEQSAPPQDDDLFEITDQMVEIRFSIMFFRANGNDTIEARDKIEELKLRVKTSSGRRHFLQRGLAWVNQGTTNDIALELDVGREKRAQADFTYYTIQTLQDTVESIDALTINAHYRGRANHYDDVITVETPQ